LGREHSIIRDLTSQRGKFFYGWWIVLTAGLGLCLGYAPIIVFSFGIFLKPLLQEFHSSRGNISAAFTLANLAQAIASPLVGRLADRFGARRVILFASVVFGSLLIFSLLPSTSLWRLYLFYVLLGIAGSGTAPVPYGKVISNWFDKRRGLALGLTMFGLGSGAIVIPSLTQRLITILGWRGAYASIGLLVLVVSVPVVGLFLKETPEEMGLLPDGGNAVHSATGQPSSEGVACGDAWHEPAFWTMIIAFFLVGASVHGCVVHLAPMLTDQGMTAERAALASSLLGAGLLIGRVGSGYLLDRVFAPRVAMLFFGGAALGMVFLWSGAGGIAYLAAFLVGLGMGAEGDIIAYLTSRYFGLRAFGEIYGYAFASYVLAGALGPWLMGLGFDRTGSYRAVLAGFLVATLLAAVAMLRLGPYRYQPR
jgi:MFS family permease